MVLGKIMSHIRPKLSLIFEVTNACNLQCPFCYVIREDRMKKQFISLERYEHVLKVYRPLYLQITGGEATVHPKFIDLLKIASKYVLEMQISSNGVLLEKYINDLLELPKIPAIGISLDAPSELHDSIRNRKGLFRRILKHIKLLKQHKIPHALAMTIFGKNDISNLPEGNLHLVDEMISFCERLHLFVNIQPFSPAKRETRVALGKKLLKSKSRYLINSKPYRKLLISGNWFATGKTSQCKYTWTNVSINSRGFQLPTQPNNCYFCDSCEECYYSCVWEPSLITSRHFLPTVRSFLKQGLSLNIL
ncbi:MAG: radical SAM protein [Candidatus Helarchaeota archaeon]|nr:radical SAM protein [Candidatus Helarchaeota archaeon]